MRSYNNYLDWGREVVLTAVSNDGRALEYASEELKGVPSMSNNLWVKVPYSA